MVTKRGGILDCLIPFLLEQNAMFVYHLINVKSGFTMFTFYVYLLGEKGFILQTLQKMTHPGVEILDNIERLRSPVSRESWHLSPRIGCHGTKYVIIAVVWSGRVSMIVTSCFGKRLRIPCSSREQLLLEGGVARSPPASSGISMSSVCLKLQRRQCSSSSLPRSRY